MDSVLTLCISHGLKPSRLIPHLEYLILGVPPDSSVLCRCARVTICSHLQFGLRLEDRVEVHFTWLMCLTLKVCILNEVRVHKELPSQVDGNYVRSFIQIWERHRFIVHVCYRWPLVRNDDAVGQHLVWVAVYQMRKGRSGHECCPDRQ